MVPDGAPTRRPLETAEEYTALGLAVIPECAPDCTTCGPRNKGKVPWDPTVGRPMAGWQQRRGPTSEELEAWLQADERHVSGGRAPANVGCVCGPGCLGGEGLIAADADGDRGISDLARHLGLAPGVLESAIAEYRQSGIFRLQLGSAAYLTQSGGLRVLWRAPAGRKLHTVGDDRGHDGLGLYWQGKQVVLPPSAGPDGDYRWLPGHSPWEIAFGPAPASVLATMAGAPAAAPTGTVALLPVPPYPAYPAAVGSRGPDRHGRLVSGQALPYDLDLLRDGVPEGQRSEALRRLELQMLRAGWADNQVVAALAAQPWVGAMAHQHGRIPVYLFRDTARARLWLHDHDGAAPRIHPEVLAFLREQKAVPPQPAGPAPKVPIGDADRTEDEEPAARQAEGREPHALAPDNAEQPALAEHAGAAAGWAYGRRRDGHRLRSYDRDRDAAMRAALEQVHEFIGALPHPTPSQLRLRAHTERLRDSVERCRTQASARPNDVRQTARRSSAGGAWLWSDAPCDGRGHEDCAPYHAVRELEPQWGPTLAEVYGSVPVTLVALSAPGWGLDATRRAATRFLALSDVRAALGLCAGYLMFEPGPAPGYALHLVVPAHRTDELRSLLLRAWRRCVPVGWTRAVDDLPCRATALEALVELRVRSEQAVLLALGRGEVSRDQAINFYAAETGVFSGTSVGGQRQRLVVAPGMRAFAKELAEGRRALAMAAGDGADGVQGPEPQGAAVTRPGVAGMGPGGACAFPLTGGGAPCGPSAAGAPEVPAGRQGPAPAAPPAPLDPRTPAGDDDDAGWVPCPWDPTLEMRPSRPRKGQPRALPWWKLERMAARGEVVPIMHNGRLIGYRTP